MKALNMRTVCQQKVKKKDQIITSTFAVCSSVPMHETSVTPGGVDVNYAGPSTHGPAPAPSSTGGGGLACLNELEQARIRELYDASRSLDEPMEKEVGWRSFFTSFSLTQPRFSSTYFQVERCA